MARPISLPPWPNGASVAVSLTFDVDSDAPFAGLMPGCERRLATRSQFRYGIVRGLPRLLDLLRDRGIAGTFYVPGATARVYPDAIRSIEAEGHEIGHHGYDHLRPHEVDADAQRDEIERGLEALVKVVRARPIGYRAPFAELTPETFALLIEHGFAYDSSCMGDDRAYVEEHEGLEILELPLHWALDDAPYFGITLDGGGMLRNPRDVIDVWMQELRLAVTERRHVTYVMHPEHMGRGPQAVALAGFLDELRERGDVWFATHAQVAATLGVPAVGSA